MFFLCIFVVFFKNHKDTWEDTPVLKFHASQRNCLKYDTQMGWLIDPEEQSVFVYIRNQQPVVLDEAEALIRVAEFASQLRLTVGNLFGWLLE